MYIWSAHAVLVTFFYGQLQSTSPGQPSRDCISARFPHIHYVLGIRMCINTLRHALTSPYLRKLLWQTIFINVTPSKLSTTNDIPKVWHHVHIYVHTYALTEMWTHLVLMRLAIIHVLLCVHWLICGCYSFTHVSYCNKQHTDRTAFALEGSLCPVRGNYYICQIEN